MPGAGRDPHFLQRDRQKTSRHLFARGDDGVVLARVVERRGVPDPGDEFVGLAGHRRDDDRDLVAGLDLALHVAGDVADAVEIGDGRAAELHDETRHVRESGL